MNNFFSPLVENAMRLASYWHQGQKRRGSELDYFTHLVGVAQILAQAGFDEEVVAAGYCHDLFEETACPPKELYDTCGDRVYQIVRNLTPDMSLDQIEYWDIIKKKYIEVVKKADWPIKAVCVADRIHNLQTMIASLKQYGLSYFQYFNRGAEKQLWFEDQICMVLQDTWDHALIREFDQLLEEFVQLLETLDQEERQGITRNPLPREFSRQSGKSVETIKPVVESESGVKVFGPSDIQAVPRVGASTLPKTYKKTKKLKKSKSAKIEIIDSETPKDPRPKLTKYLTAEETRYILPAALQIALTEGEVTNQFFQDKLQVNYLVAHRLLKEFKRLHIIKRADSFKPRKVNKSKIKELLKEIKK